MAEASGMFGLSHHTINEYSKIRKTCSEENISAENEENISAENEDVRPGKFGQIACLHIDGKT